MRDSSQLRVQKAQWKVCFRDINEVRFFLQCRFSSRLVTCVFSKKADSIMDNVSSRSPIRSQNRLLMVVFEAKAKTSECLELYGDSAGESVRGIADDSLKRQLSSEGMTYSVSVLLYVRKV
ncbi:hypothetical protein LOAG_07313 [Loa loa]|uniref:Uncharacterized protein n=1 Tax=Loa loa TaxID=7209 RepID=A0A1S0TW20_LOALO|nr:hypothetical protein LOAG_07313 [Loa loa]EFO21177.1 hypothetical protein LOAG_07313 [Loa loa]